MDTIMGMTSDPIFWGYSAVLLLLGIIVGWLFTRRGWKKRANEAEGRITDLQAAQRRMERDWADQPVEIDQLQDSLDAAVDQRDKLQSELDEAKASLAAAEAESALTEEEIESIEAEADEDVLADVEAPEEDEVEIDVVEIEDESDEDELDEDESDEDELAEDELDEEESDEDELVEDAAALAAAVALEAKAIAEATELREQLNLLQEEFDAASQNATSDVERARSQVAELEVKQVDLMSELDAAHEHLLSAESTVEELKSQSDSADEGVESKNIALKEAYAQVVGLQLLLEACQGQFSSTKSDLELAQSQVNELEAVREKLEKRVAQSRAEVAVDLAALTAAQLKIKDDAMAEANQKIAELTVKLNQLQG